VVDVPSEWCSALHVDQNDSFFFDHPLDHVPGMLVFDAMTRAVGQAAATLLARAAGPRRIATMHIRFPSFCEKDRPLLLHVRRAGARHDALLAETWQDGARVCTAEVDTVADHAGPDGPARVPSDPAPGPPDPAPPRADRRMVHKRLAGNVLVGPLWVADPDERGAAFGADVPVPSADLRSQISPVTLLVEAARQLILMGGHQVTGIPMEWQYVITSLRLRLAGPVGWARPVTLRSHSRGQDKRATGFDVTACSGKRPLGEISIQGRAMPPPVYRRMRYAGRTAPAPVPDRTGDLDRAVAAGPA
jgi:hypothetical protein